MASLPFLTEIADKIFVKFDKNADKKELLSLMSADGFIKRENEDEQISDFVILEMGNKIGVSKTTFEKYKTRLEIISLMPLLQYNNTLQGLTDEFVLKLKETTSLEQLQNLAIKNNCRIIQENRLFKNQYILSVPKTSMLNAMQNG